MTTNESCVTAPVTKKVDVVIIGGGPAGMAAAVSAYKSGVTDILILERDERLGGILNQCIHQGFGLHKFKEELTGPEYAGRYIKEVLELGIPFKTGAMVTDVTADRIVTYKSEDEGEVSIVAGAVILAMGARERSRGQLNIPGTRPQGVYTAGTAQRYVNVKGYMPGRRIVILGSGDIGLIMARRMTLEGAKVMAVCELMPYSGGLARNIAQCLNDFDIPLLLSHTVTDIHGKKRITGVTISAVDGNRNPIPGTEQYIECDTLLLSCGLLPENELSKKAGVALSPVTGGAIVNDRRETSVPGIFSCGNVLHIHDLVDYVSDEGELCGIFASEFVKDNRGTNRPSEAVSSEAVKSDEASSEAVTSEAVKSEAVTYEEASSGAIAVVPEGIVRYSVPMTITQTARDVKIFFRVSRSASDVTVTAASGNEVLCSVRKKRVAPGEMENITIKADRLKTAAGEIRLFITEKEVS
ncbi:MAG: FAD-dependent oxidoreductase [Clostridia bacterium]|nr:FAD-dependent oxidoreductase [Clostridia bacterium]